MTKENTYISNVIDAAESSKIQYDRNAKNILADKQILARILKYTLDEFRGMEIEKIISCIEGTPYVGEIPVEPGLTNSLTERIQGDTTESNIQNEGVIFFDVRFHTLLGEEKCKILIDLEAQKSGNAGNLGYHIENRMTYYLGRMVSAQKETEFHKSDYDSLKKVKSIWICMNAEHDSITKFRFMPKAVYGILGEEPISDQIEGVLIRIRSKDNVEASKNELISMLEDLLRTDDKTIKKDNLQKKHGIHMTEEFEGRLNVMCNISEVVFEQAFEKGLARGIEDGIERGIERGIEQGIDQGIEQGIENVIEQV
ncbi:MAG: hypothetical protein LUG83_00405, partial [Lachnospiraceae bacterium]|nr:hypothetical protein [Lachnospiraceae bacterium]